MLDDSAVFPDPFATHPPLVRRMLRSALRLDDLDSLYRSARSQVALGRGGLSTSALKALDVRVAVSHEDLERIPATGALIAVANHPHGFLDGFVLDHVLEQSRSDVRLLVNQMISGIPEMSGRCIGVSVLEGTTNLKAVRESLQWLKDKHAVAIFPAGEVSHWRHDRGCVTDCAWSPAFVRWALRCSAIVLPIYLRGANSFLFQLAGAFAVPPIVRTARLPYELLNKRASQVEVRIGAPIAAEELMRAGVDEAAASYVRARVYMLGRRFDGQRAPAGNNSRSRPAPVAGPAAGVYDEIRRLQNEGRCLVENHCFSVYAARGEAIPALLREIGRLREHTFRAVGEGTGRERDLDRFDLSYTHLILWHKETAAIAGSYRLAWTEDAAHIKALPDLYTAKLFRYEAEFFARLGPSVEMGRSFIVEEHQRDYTPLLLLWQAIGRCVAERPEAPVLFGAVSISAEYPAAARELMVSFLRERCFRDDLARFVTPRKRFVGRLVRKHEVEAIIRCLEGVEDLPLGDIAAQSSVPVLLRQYLRLGGKVAAFNVDPQFSNALDALLVVDLRQTPLKLLRRYMGTAAADSFLEQAPKSEQAAPGNSVEPATGGHGNAPGGTASKRTRG